MQNQLVKQIKQIANLVHLRFRTTDLKNKPQNLTGTRRI